MYLLSQYQPGIITIINYAQKFIQAPLALIQQIIYDILPNPNSCSAMIVRNRKMAIEVHTVNKNKRMGKMSYTAMETLSSLIGIMTFAMPFTAISLACMNT